MVQTSGGSRPWPASGVDAQCVREQPESAAGWRQTLFAANPTAKIPPRRRLTMDDLTPMQDLTPEQVVARLAFSYDHACSALRQALSRYTTTGIGPTAAERRHFRYPRLDVAWHPTGPVRHTTTRAWAKLQDPGVYSTTITQPAFFRAYLL